MAHAPDRPRILTVLPGLFPATVTLAVKPLLALHRAGRVAVDFALELTATRRQVEQADVVVFCRNLEPAYGSLLQAAQGFGKPIVYVLDDDFFAVPPGTEEGRYYREPGRLRQLEQYLAAATLVRVHSRALHERVAPYNSNVEQVGSPLYWDLIAGLPRPSHAPNVVKVVYMTGRVYDTLAAVFLEDARRILERYGRGVELHFWGYHPPELKSHPSVRLAKLVTDYDSHLRQFFRQGYDIGLAPLLDDDFHRAKTDTKFREYGACQVAGIYSNVEVYSSCVKHGETGLLVFNQPGLWYEAMARLIEDRGLREKIQAQAQDYVRRHYSSEAFQEGWWEHLRQLLHAPASASPTAAASIAGPVEQSRERPALGRLARQGWSLVDRLRRRGLAATWHTSGWYWHNLWMLLRLRVQTSPLADRLR